MVRRVELMGVAVALIAGVSSGGVTVVEVDDGEELRESNLNQGEFMGQEFTLGSDAVFDINFGGAIGPVGEMFPDGVPIPDNPFDFQNSTVNLNDGGTFRSGSLFSDVHINLRRGGLIGIGSEADTGSVINYLGGRIEQGFRTRAGSAFNIEGGEFRLNGNAVTSLPNGLTVNDTLTGTLADGTPFILPGVDDIVLQSGTTNLSTVDVDPIDTTPIFVDSGVSSVQGLRTGQSLTLSGTGALPRNFTSVGGSLDVQGGTVMPGFQIADTQLNISGGVIDSDIRAYQGSSIELSGGSVDGSVDLRGSSVNIIGGSHSFVLSLDKASALDLNASDASINLSIRENSVATVRGGEVRALTMRDDAVLNIEGGLVFRANSTAELEVPEDGVVNMSGGRAATFDFLDRSTFNMTDGEVGGFEAQSGTSIDISGGRITGGFMTSSEDMTISGGLIGTSSFSLDSINNIGFGSGSSTSISGGVFAQGIDAVSGSDVTLVGGEFTRNGETVTDFTGAIEPNEDDIFTATLSDGSVMILASTSADRIDAGTLTLQSAELEPADTTPMHVSSGVVSKGLRAGQTLTVSGDAEVIPSFAAVGSTLNIEGGTVGDGLETYQAQVNISGGSIGEDARFLRGSEVTMSGGEIDFDARVNEGASFAMSGGEIREMLVTGEADLSGGEISDLRFTGDSDVTVSGDFFALDSFVQGNTDLTIEGGFLFSLDAVGNASINMSGGRVSDVRLPVGTTMDVTGGSLGFGFEATGGALTMSGGTFSSAVDIASGSDFTLIGGDYRLDGLTVTDLSGGLPEGAIFTGTLEDGSVFIFDEANAGDTIDPNTLTLTAGDLDAPDTTPMIVTTGDGPNGLRPGQTLTLRGDANVPRDFGVVSATLNVEGGEPVEQLEAVDSTIRLSEGEIAGLRLHGDTFFEMTGGVLSFVPVAAFNDGVEARISGGTATETVRASSGSLMTITGGTFERGVTIERDARGAISGGLLMSFFAEFDSTTDITGGNFAGGFFAQNGSMINISVRELAINGDTPDIAVGETITLDLSQDILFEATLADGSFFDITNIESIRSDEIEPDFLDPDATINITLVPAPGAPCLIGFATGMALARRRR